MPVKRPSETGPHEFPRWMSGERDGQGTLTVGNEHHEELEKNASCCIVVLHQEVNLELIPVQTLLQ